MARLLGRLTVTVFPEEPWAEIVPIVPVYIVGSPYPMDESVLKRILNCCEDDALLPLFLIEYVTLTESPGLAELWDEETGLEAGTKST